MPATIPQIPLAIPSSPPAYSAPAPPPYTPHPSIIHLGPSIFSLAAPSEPPSPTSFTHQTFDRNFQAALREYQATQDPQNWGTRATHPRRNQQLAEMERVEGWRGWAMYLVKLMAPEIPVGPGGRGLAMSVGFATPPFM